MNRNVTVDYFMQSFTVHVFTKIIYFSMSYLNRINHLELTWYVLKFLKPAHLFWEIEHIAMQYHSVFCEIIMPWWVFNDGDCGAARVDIRSVFRSVLFGCLVHLVVFWLFSLHQWASKISTYSTIEKQEKKRWEIWLGYLLSWHHSLLLDWAKSILQIAAFWEPIDVAKI